jgi:homoserine kinase
MTTDRSVARGLPSGAVVNVSVPASSANLGPGFDSLALALDLRETFTVRVVDGDVGDETFVEGVEPGGLVGRTVVDTLRDLGCTPRSLRIASTSVIPQGRGLGSSGAAISAAVAAAIALATGDPDPADVLDRAARIEGHADNVAASVLGGLAVCWRDDEEREMTPSGRPWRAVRLEPQEIKPMVLLPEDALPTAAARAALPPTVPHSDAAATVGRAALLVVALTGAVGTDLLLAATEDWLHQPYRATVMPQSLRLVRALRSRGLPAVVSGAGPAVLVLDDADRRAADLAGNGWQGRSVGVDRRGLTLVRQPATT